ncbi:hypothetical protein CVT24_009482 [Panaeolus cyanescens]|uniref:HNH nuclease domain-containing protein n=1 Tax=Panaeolus cyanescens TaxID=181874 RepID=A0A409WEQ4_9AGAR|nr:hypothetical protein CVT24_009482 [Panaeolus cyanescens]
MTRSAIKRAEDADPNLQRCLIENCSTTMAVQLGHVYEREEAARDHRMESLEWIWGLVQGSLNLDTRRNIFFVGASLYEMYKRRRWTLVPEEQVVRQFFYEGGRRPRTRRDFPKFQTQTFKYTFLPIKDIEDVYISRQSEDNTVTVHEYPFSGIPAITSHIHPTFVLLQLANALWSIPRDRYDSILKQYPWLSEICDLRTHWFARLPDNADRNLTYRPSRGQQNLSTTSQTDSEDDLLRTPPRRLRLLVPQLSDWEWADAERLNNPPSSTRVAPREPVAVYQKSVKKRDLCEPNEDTRCNKRGRRLTSTGLEECDGDDELDIIERRQSRILNMCMKDLTGPSRM